MTTSGNAHFPWTRSARGIACLALILAAPVAAAVEHGLIGRYFPDKELVGPAAFERLDPAIDFDWGFGSPNDIGKPFSVFWSGTIDLPAAGTWTFTVTSDDGVAVSIDDRVVVMDWSDHAPREASGALTVGAAGPRWITVAFYDQGGLAVAQLDWQGPGVGRQRVPTTAFLPTARSPQPAVVPASSPVSPLSLDLWPAAGDSAAVKVGGHPVAPITLAPGHQVIEAPLAEQPTPVSIDLGAGKVNHLVEWTPTTLSGDSSAVLRVGDSLLLRAPVAGDLRVLLECGVVAGPIALKKNRTLPYRFDVQGHYQVEFRDGGGGLIGAVAVTAVDAVFPLPIADQIGYARRYRCEVRPEAALAWFGIDDPTRGAVATEGVAETTATLRLVAFSEQPARVVARLGGPAGPLLGLAPISAYRLLDNTDGGYVFHRDEDGFGHATYTLRMKPRIPDQRIVIDFFTGAATVDGLGHLELLSDALEDDGSFQGEMLIFPGNDITCHAISVFEERP